MGRRPTSQEEPDRIARTGLGGGQPPRRVQVPGAVGRVASRGPTTFERYARPQRVIVKTHVARHFSPQKGRESIGRHVRYLTREAVKCDPQSGRFFDAKRDELDGASETRPWADDRHHFRIILSAENARSLSDLRAYAREVMVRVERDIGPLQWLAVNHNNTDNPHTHLLIRGKAQNGTDLVISRAYISNGIRQRAAEVATEFLGERTREEAQIAIAKEIRAERWTSLDGAIARVARPAEEGLNFSLKDVQLHRYGLVTNELLTARLSFLAEAGLAEQIVPQKRTFLGRHSVWHVRSDFQKRLNELGARHDVIKQLHASLGKAAAAVVPQLQRVGLDASLSSKTTIAIRGVVLAKGTINELSDERFVVLEDRAGKPHYLRLWASEQLDAVRVGGALEVGRSAERRRHIGREIIRVVEYAKDGRYSIGRHREWIQAQSPRPSAPKAEQRLRIFAGIMSRLVKQPDSGVVPVDKKTCTVDGAKLEQLIAKRNRWLDVRVVSAFALGEQISAPAYTWLDRQILRERLVKEIAASDLTRNPQVQSALTQRSDWLVQHGFAHWEKHKGARKLEFLHGAVTRLVSNEHQELAKRCTQKSGKNLLYLREGQVVAGAYRGTVFQHRGTFALVETPTGIFAAPVSRPPWAEKGQQVSARAVAPKFARIEFDRTGVRTKSFGVER